MTPPKGWYQLPNRAEKAWPVKVETTGGQGVTGKLNLGWVKMESELGLYHVKPEKIKAIRFVQQGGPLIVGPQGARADGVIDTTSGEEIVGTFHVQNWTLITDLGVVLISPGKLKSITFTDPADPQVGKKEGPAEKKNEPSAEKK